MKADIISPGVIHLTTDDQYELSSAFMRIQEFYESANGLRGKFFTLEECMDVYAKNQKKKAFTYTSDWAGFNVPGHVVDEFIKKFRKDFLEKEKVMFDLLAEKLKEDDGKHDGRYYLIGTYACLDSTSYIYHEHCHALWYMYPKFKRESMKVIRKLPLEFRKTLKEALVRDGYDTSVLEDETNAYLATSDMYYIRDAIMSEYKRKSFPWQIIYELQKNFYEFHASVQDKE